MRISFLCVRIYHPAAYLLPAIFLAGQAFAQQTPPAAPPTTPPASQQPAQSQAQAPLTLPPASKEPDYPDRRTFFIGAIGLAGLQSYAGPNTIGGTAAAAIGAYENLYGWGKPYRVMPSIEAAYPITRTGMLVIDIARYHGAGGQILGGTATPLIDGYTYNPGDDLSTGYHVLTGRIYLDDLLYPEKFPVPRLRFHSIWGFRMLNMTNDIDSPTEDAANSSTTAASTGLITVSAEQGGGNIFYPEFGLAMEYAIKPHVLFRIDGAGFAIPHHAVLSETSASLSVRKENLEILAGVKTLHFKTNPQKEEYQIGTFITPFIEIRWHMF